MTLTRWNPMPDLERLERTLLSPLAPESEEMMSAPWVPSVDVAEEPERVIIRAEVPGIDPKDIDIRFDDGRLTLSGERRQESEDDGRTWHRVERFYGRFTRTFTLPVSVDADKATASYASGVLEIVMPKREDAQPKRIAIGATRSASKAQGQRRA